MVAPRASQISNLIINDEIKVKLKVYTVKSSQEDSDHKASLTTTNAKTGHPIQRNAVDSVTGEAVSDTQYAFWTSRGDLIPVDDDRKQRCIKDVIGTDIKVISKWPIGKVPERMHTGWVYLAPHGKKDIAAYRVLTNALKQSKQALIARVGWQGTSELLWAITAKKISENTLTLTASMLHWGNNLRLPNHVDAVTEQEDNEQIKSLVREIEDIIYVDPAVLVSSARNKVSDALIADTDEGKAKAQQKKQDKQERQRASKATGKADG